MDYFYENLGDEKFQEFCQSLLNKEFPNSQAFPVGQRDGGRDSVSYYLARQKKDFIVFQVKYVREPLKIQDSHKWLTEIIEKESDKIDKLITQGAKAYYILTNVPGTAYPEKGSIDKVNSILEEKISIPAICWWRGDLSRKLEGHIDLKWSYTEILNGQEILNSLIFQNLEGNQRRKDSVLKAYLVDQYSIDSEVKFKQIELQSLLFDLFIDVPIRLKELSKNIDKYRRIFRDLSGRREEYIGSRIILIDDTHPEIKKELGTASFLLNYFEKSDIKRILLEGGPGQGKSTITQFVCQVNRVKILNKPYEIAKLPEYAKNAPLRLPFKIDLRDLALWVSKKNPYTGFFSEEKFLLKWQKSLEAFLVYHISYHSNIEEFTTADFISICNYSSILFVFDGFDEIADIRIREEIIELINKGINRINENSKSIKVIITSRPAAFASSSGFSIEDYPHFELKDINSEIINEYVEKWILIRKIRDREANEIRRLVKEKLELAHLKDLAKSPMQLAIFLSLLSTRGESLPNRRTELYDSYIELFFNREAEKNVTVRQERDLIINIHQFLAWKLHSEAELYNSNGRIEISQLKTILKFYLEKEGHPTEIADKLFTVVEERVCALVSRVQGTFEFEVQPLREYFCAKYLYKTSPYAPVGTDISGTKPDRFDALSKNFYWQNVLRFFAGCFDRGELPMLILKLKELQENKYFKYTNYPRILTSQLLSDYVFSGYPRLLVDVVKIIIDGIDIRAILNQNNIGYRVEPIMVPEKCGREEIIRECFNQLSKFPAEDYASELIELINNNSYRTFELWQENGKDYRGDKLTKWLEYGYFLRLFYRIKLEEIRNLFNRDQKINDKRLQILIDANRIDVLTRYFKTELIESILNNRARFGLIKRNQDYKIEKFSFLLNPEIYNSFFDEAQNNISLKQFLKFRSEIHYYSDPVESYPNFENAIDHNQNEIDSKIDDFLNSINKGLETPLKKWTSSIEPWDELIEKGVRIFGEASIFKIIAVLGGGIKSTGEKYLEFNDLDDSSVSLAKRVRNARLKSGNINWWENELKTSNDFLFTLQVFFTWATPKTILHFLYLIDEKLVKLHQFEIEDLLKSLHSTCGVSKLTQSHQRKLMIDLQKIESSDLIKYIISLRFSGNNYKEFVNQFLSDYKGSIKEILIFKLNILLEDFLSGNHNWSVVKKIKSVYLLANNFNENYYPLNRYSRRSLKIPFEIAKEIMEDSKNLPRILVSMAEIVCRNYVAKKIEYVGKIAERERWFEY